MMPFMGFLFVSFADRNTGPQPYVPKTEGPDVFCKLDFFRFEMRSFYIEY